MKTFFVHSLVASIGSTILVLILAFPAAYACRSGPFEAWRDGLFFFISTKMLPIVGAIVPLYVLASPQHLDILDTSRVCRTELRAKFVSDGRVVELAEYVPKMNVTPNAVALKDD